MNKYQEAKAWIDKINDHAEWTRCDIEEPALSQLKELVDRDTPKKPIKDESSKIRYVQTYVCPNCGGGFSGMISNFCYHCGQKLDWSDEE